MAYDAWSRLFCLFFCFHLTISHHVTSLYLLSLLSVIVVGESLSEKWTYKKLMHDRVRYEKVIKYAICSTEALVKLSEANISCIDRMSKQLDPLFKVKYAHVFQFRSTFHVCMLL